MAHEEPLEPPLSWRAALFGQGRRSSGRFGSESCQAQSTSIGEDAIRIATTWMGEGLKRWSCSLTSSIVSARRTCSFGSPVVRTTERRLSPSPSCSTSLVLSPARDTTAPGTILARSGTTGTTSRFRNPESTIHGRPHVSQPDDRSGSPVRENRTPGFCPGGGTKGPSLPGRSEDLGIGDGVRSGRGCVGRHSDSRRAGRIDSDRGPDDVGPPSDLPPFL